MYENNYKLEEIPCPKCKEKSGIDANKSIPVTVWGEEGRVAVFCAYCETKFYVKEDVNRTYCVYPGLS